MKLSEFAAIAEDVAPDGWVLDGVRGAGSVIATWRNGIAGVIDTRYAAVCIDRGVVNAATGVIGVLSFRALLASEIAAVLRGEK